jgi:exodeoxyribonuclease VII large subunit
VKIAAFRLRLERRTADLRLRAERLVRTKRDRLEKFSLQLAERSPLKVLERGYAIATDANGLLRDSSQVSIGDTISLRLHRGRLSAEVKKKEGE